MREPERFEIPFIGGPADVEKASEALADMKKAMSLARAKLTVIEVEQFFLENPNVESVDVSGDYESNDEGGSYLSMSGTVNFKDEDLAAESDVDVDDLGYEFANMFGNFAERMMDVAVVSGKQVGEILLGAQACGAWMAEREKVEIEKVAKVGVETDRGAKRM